MTDVGMVDLPGDRIGDVSRDHGDDGILLHHQGVRMHAYEGTSLTFVQIVDMPADTIRDGLLANLDLTIPVVARPSRVIVFFDHWSTPRAREIRMVPNRTAFLTVVALFHPLLAFAQQAQPPTSSQPPWEWPGPWHMWSGGWGFWWILPSFMLFMMVICVAMFFFGHIVGGRGHWGPWEMLDRPFGPGRPSGDPTYSALQILNERLAKGEIEKQEYEEKQAAILASRQQ